MQLVFEQGTFNKYRSFRLDEARAPIPERYQILYKPTVFLSHKHDDLNDLRDVIGFLETTYDVKVYIDSQDSTMPAVTSGETASQIKQRIVKCQKFIFLATNGAVESKWCNWELGYGDAQKFERDCIALFPIKPQGFSDYLYKGLEYLTIYPHIVYANGTEQYIDGRYIPAGYYVRTIKGTQSHLTDLHTWLHR